MITSASHHHRYEPSISVVINNYNYEQYVGDAIESALVQNYENVEVLVVDDGSTDASREVIGRYAEKIKPIYKENGGQGSAFNSGFAASTGQVVIFLDADDVLNENASSCVAQAFREECVSKMTWRMNLINSEGEMSGKLYPPYTPDSGDLLGVLSEKGPYGFYVSPTSGNAWNRNFLRSVLPMPEPIFRINADSYLFWLSPIYGKAILVDSPLSRYRVHDANAYVGRSAFDTVVGLDQQYRELCHQLIKHLTRKGVDFDASKWDSFHLKLIEMKSAILETIPEVGRVLLIDGDELNVGASLFGRPRGYMMERDGGYWGPPASDTDAETELARLRTWGVEYIVFTEDTLWWLEQYPSLMALATEGGEEIASGRWGRIYRIH